MCGYVTLYDVPMCIPCTKPLFKTIVQFIFNNVKQFFCNQYCRCNFVCIFYEEGAVSQYCVKNVTMIFVFTLTCILQNMTCEVQSIVHLAYKLLRQRGKALHKQKVLMHSVVHFPFYEKECVIYADCVCWSLLFTLILPSI